MSWILHLEPQTYTPTLSELSLWLVFNEFVYQKENINVKESFKHVPVILRIVDVSKSILMIT